MCHHAASLRRRDSHGRRNQAERQGTPPFRRRSSSFCIIALPGASRMCPCTISSARCWCRSMPKESARWRNRWPETEYVITLRHPVAAAISTYEKSTGLPARAQCGAQSVWCSRATRSWNVGNTIRTRLPLAPIRGTRVRGADTAYGALQACWCSHKVPSAATIIDTRTSRFSRGRIQPCRRY